MIEGKNRAVIVFLRSPRKGYVKTRLAAKIGDDAALFVYKKLLSHTFHVLQKTDARLFFFLTEIEKQMHFPFPKSRYSVIKQCGNDLGERMKNAFDEVFDLGYRQAIIIGTDNIQLLPRHIEQAFKILQEKEVVIGPSNDGGYYLLGMNKVFEDLFEGITWSTEKVYDQSIKKVMERGLSIGMLEELTDVDVYDDLVQTSWQNVLKDLKSPG